MNNQVKPATSSGDTNPRGRVLVVDDDSMMRRLYQAILASTYDVVSADSGEEALAICKEQMPDMILLDIEMPVMNGYEVCKRVREFSNAPIIFVTAHQSIEEHLKAYNAGGNDIITKPIDIQILQFKIDLSFKNLQLQQQQLKEKKSQPAEATSFLSTAAESGILINFMRGSLGCRSYTALAGKLVEAARSFGIECSVLIRYGNEITMLTTHGEATSLEQSILEQSSKLGREFQFKNRLVINHKHISIMVSNLPRDDKEKADQIRENISILAETAEALTETVEMRIESMARAEQMQVALGNSIVAIENLRSKSRQTLSDSCVLLQDLIQNVEKSYSWLDTTKEQEAAISGTMNESAQRILNVFSVGSETEKDFEKVLDGLRGDNAGSVDDVFF